MSVVVTLHCLCAPPSVVLQAMVPPPLTCLNLPEPLVYVTVPVYVRFVGLPAAIVSWKVRRMGAPASALTRASGLTVGRREPATGQLDAQCAATPLRRHLRHRRSVCCCRAGWDASSATRSIRMSTSRRCACDQSASSYMGGGLA